tara:strand:+ start:81 stop:356 length:276 start_codon:yes stop_codon:yes gene_type:complete
MALKCIEEVKKCGTPCRFNRCRYWMEYKEDLNCSMIAIEKHGEMSLSQIAQRLGVTIPMVFHTERNAAQKLKQGLTHRHGADAFNRLTDES